MVKASDNEFPKVILKPLGAPSAPSDAAWKVYPMADGIYARSSNTIVGPFGSGSGTVGTDTIWDAAGDLVQGTGANTAARLALGASGTVVRSNGSTNAYAYPPGHEFDYVAFTSPVSITATTEGTANTIVTGSSVAYDGSTVVLVTFFAPYYGAPSSTASDSQVILYEDGTSIGSMCLISRISNAASQRDMVAVTRRITPTNASHTYSIRAYISTGTGSMGAGVGGSAAHAPGFIRITKA